MSSMDDSNAHVAPIEPTSDVPTEQKAPADFEETVQVIRCLIENSQVGGIIGEGGANVSAARESSGAYISILKAEYKNVQERIMLLKGTASQISSATELVAKLLINAVSARKKEAQPDPDAQTSIRYLVNRSAVGAIIGRGGAVIQDIQKQSGARVQVSNDPLPQSTEKSVTITGTPTAIQQAALRVLQQLRDNPLKSVAKVYLYVPGQPIFASPYGLSSQFGQLNVAAMQHGGLGVGVGGVGVNALGLGLGGPPHAPPQASSTQKIAIPTVCAGCVIGKGGAVIRDLRHQSGTNISIADPDPASPNERIVTLTGSPQGIQAAVFLIRQLVEQYQPPENY